MTPMDVLSPDVFPLRTFYPHGRFVRQMLCRRTFCPARRFVWRDMQHGNAAWSSRTYSMDMQHYHSPWACSMGMQQGHAAWTCSINMRHGHSAWKCNKDKSMDVIVRYSDFEFFWKLMCVQFWIRRRILRIYYKRHFSTYISISFFLNWVFVSKKKPKTKKQLKIIRKYMTHFQL